MLTSFFAAEMARLQAPREVAVAVSGGADSTALALLAHGWGRVLALIVDHGLRAGSGAEAALTRERLAARGIAARVITLSGLAGPGLQARARAKRAAALAEAAYAAGLAHVLLGHHAADQSETVAMRAARGDGGAAGMAAWSARERVVLLRPLLNVQPAELRAYLQDQGMAWVEDPSNQNPAFERVRLRQAGAAAVADDGKRRAEDAQARAFLAAQVSLYPAGFAVVAADAAPLPALAALLRVVGGADYAPARGLMQHIATGLRPCTLGGVQILPAGRLGPGWLLAREPAACAAPIPAVQGAWWDGRFRLTVEKPGMMLGAYGKAKFTKHLPAIVQQTMPALHGQDGSRTLCTDIIFAPPMPAAGGIF